MSDLTPTEVRILRLILAGKSNEAIAAELRWPNGHKLRICISRLYAKLGVETPRELLPRVEELRALAK